MKKYFQLKKMNMKRLAILSMIAMIALVACSKLEIKKGIPKCVSTKIQEFSKETTCGDANVKEYLFQGVTVYVFDYGTCGADFANPVIDSDCKELGYLGGITGNTKINGEEFSTATYLRTVWKK